MPRIQHRLAPGGLHLNNAPDQNPEGTLRVARNLAAQGSGVVRSTGPRRTISTTVAAAKSLTKFRGKFHARGNIAGTDRIRRETAAGSNVYGNVTMPAAVTLPSSTAPMLFLPASPVHERDEYLFALDAGQTPGNNALLKIDDAGNATNWGIREPTAANVTSITPTKLAQNTKYINTVASDPFDSAAGWTLSDADESPTGLGGFTARDAVANPAIEATNSLRFRVAKDDHAQIIQTFGSDVDLTTFGAVTSPDEDFIQFWVRVKRPKHVTSVDIAFDLTAAGDFKSDFYTRELTFQTVRKKKKRKLISLGDLIPLGDEQAFLQKQQYQNPDLTISETQGNQKILVSKNTWTRVTLPKTSFDRSGNGTQTWANVRAIRITVQSNKLGRTTLYFDELKLVGGIGMLGDYDYTITYRNDDTGTRSNPAIDDDEGTATNFPNAIVKVTVRDVERQGVRLTFTTGLTFDPQVNEIEIWRTVGNGKAYFKAGVLAPTAPGVVGVGTTFDDNCADYFGLHSSADNVLDPTLELPLDNTSPNHPDFCFTDMIDRLHYGRVFWSGNKSLTDSFTLETKDARGLVYYSPIGRVEAVDAFVSITAGASDPVQKLAVWNDRLFAFTKSALYEIVGTDEPFVPQRVEGCPGTLEPWTVVSTQHGLLWLAEDGIYQFNGQYAKNITDQSLIPLFRLRQTTEGLGAPQAGSMRAVAGRNAYYLAPMGAGASPFTLVLDFEQATFRYIQAFAPAGVNSGAQFFDFVTGQLVGDSEADSSADITEMEPQPHPTTGTLTFVVQPPTYRTGPGRQGILRKVYVDLTTDTSGDGGVITPSLVINETLTALASFVGPAAGTRAVREFNVNMPGDRFAINLQGGLVRNLIVNSLELDIYEPELDE